ncbi:MAG: hypothetical protein V7629_07245 [Motiliproteus sp.]
MPTSPITHMLLAWQQHTIRHLPQVNYEVAVDRDDVIKLEALSELYQLPLDDIIASLVSCALKETEQKIPYIQGQKIIRTEEGEPVYEDIGDTPRYLEIKQQLERHQKQHQKQHEKQQAQKQTTPEPPFNTRR